jgi:hypothetical protein
MEIILTIVIPIILIPISWLVYRKLDQFFKTRKNEEIAEEYFSGLRDKDRHIDSLEKELGEKHQIINALKRSGISTARLIERYDKPLNAILISYSHQIPPVFIKEELPRFNSKWLGGDVSIIPPASVPKNIKNQDDLKYWFENEILKGRQCKLKFLILFDLKSKTYWHTYRPDAHIERYHSSIGEKLNVEDLFTPEQIKLIALKDLIQDGDIAWLSSRVLSTNELENILLNQITIENELEKPSLRELADDNMIDKLTQVLEQYLKNPKEISRAIIEEAKFWQSILR